MEEHFASTLQLTFQATLVLKLTKDLCILIGKIVNTQPEAKKLLGQIHSLRVLTINIESKLRSRDENRKNGLHTTSDEAVADRGLYVSMFRCRTQLRDMKGELAPLRDVDSTASATTIRDRFGFVLDTGLFQKHGLELEWQIRTISLVLDMLDYCPCSHDGEDRPTNYWSDRARFVELANLLQECHDLPPEGPPSGTLSPANEKTEEEEEATFGHVQAATILGTSHDHREDDHSRSQDAIDTPIIEDEQNPVDLPDSASREDVAAASTTSLMTIVKRKHPRTQLQRVKKRLERDPPENVCVYDEDDWTVLHHAVLQENPALLELLLQDPRISEADYLNARNVQGHTALMEACKRADHEKGSRTAHLLLERECDVNAIDDSQQERSALYFVVQRPGNKYSIPVADALLSKGASLEPVVKGLPEKLGAYPSVNEAANGLNREDRRDRGSLAGRVSVMIHAIPH